MVDAVALVLSEDECEMLLGESTVIQFVMDAFGHLRAIGSSAAAKPLLDKVARLSFSEDYPGDRRRYRSRRSDGLKPDASSAPRLGPQEQMFGLG
jgi:hypothetical protein